MGLSEMGKDLELLKEMERCVHCGACRAVCPTFSVFQREMAAARGKISLCHAFEQGEVGLSDKLIDAVKGCLTCAACRENCPNSVDLPSIILAIRAAIYDKRGLPLRNAVVDRALSSPFLLSLAMKAGSIISPLLLKGVPETSGLHLRFPLPFIDRERLLPAIAERSFIDVATQVHRDRGKEKAPRHLRVGLFAGCLINYMLPEIGVASLKVLERAGVEVFVPSGQGCCGMPALNMGDRGTAKMLALKNLMAFEDEPVDFIITSCATCATGLKMHLKELLSDEESDIRDKAEGFASKVREISEFIIRDTKKCAHGIDIKIGNGRSVTYHDPCHMSRYLRLKDEPRELLEATGMRFVEMGHPCRCCGLGGTFSIDYYEATKRIGMEKAADIEETGADMVATSCPGCVIQLKDALHHIGVEKKVLHVVEIVAGALKDD